MNSNRKLIIFSLATVTVCFLALYIHQHRQGRTGKVDNALLWITGRFQNNLSFFSTGLEKLFSHYVLLVNTAKQNELLHRELLEVKQQLVQLNETESELRRLRNLLDFKNSISMKMLAARVIGQDVSGDFRGLKIDKGRQDGIQIGMGVIHSGGVVGRIQRVSETFSEVLTVTDPASNIDVIVQRSRARGIVSGSTDSLFCKLRYMDRLEDITQDDVIITTQFGNIFPRGILVGHVTEIESTSNGILLDISLKTAIDTHRLEEVLVVIPSNRSEKNHS